MKIATWNINGVVRRLDVLLRWLDAARPDVLCLQELKCPANRFPDKPLAERGYQAVWAAAGRWNGVAILARGRAPVLTADRLEGDSEDPQPRYIEAAVAGRIVASVYAPNGNPCPGPKFDYKLAWLDRLRARAQTLLDQGAPVVLVGDFNVVPEARDIYPTRSYDDDALMQPAARQALGRLMATGLVDVYRRLEPKATAYTFWDYRRRRWERDAGLRLDLLLADPGTAQAARAAGVDRAPRGWPDASDHAPVWVDLG